MFDINKNDIDPMIRFCYDFVLHISENRILATHGGVISLLDNTGYMICTYDSIELAMYEFPEETYIDEDGIEVGITKYVENRLLILEDDSWGIMDFDGNVLLEPSYKKISFIDSVNICVI